MFLKDKYLVSINTIKPWLMHKAEIHREGGSCSTFTCIRQGQGQNIDKITTNAQLCNPMGCFCTFLFCGTGLCLKVFWEITWKLYILSSLADAKSKTKFDLSNCLCG